MQEQEIITVHDSKNFHYEVELRHSPQHGFSTAYYKGSIVAQVELYKIHKPHTDNDADWERYEETFGEWRDEIITNMQRACKEHFNREQ